VSEPVVCYVPRRNATPEGELKALAAVYRFVLERRAQKATDDGRPQLEGGTNGILSKESEEKVISRRVERQ
jgi:hypothetical protein